MQWHMAARVLIPAALQAAVLLGAAMVDVGLLDAALYRVVARLVTAISGL